jgi:predicted transcriptional regulator
MTVLERELRDFEHFVMSSSEGGNDELALEDYVCLWRAQQEQESTRAAIREGLDDLDAGRIRAASDVVSELREKLSRAS